MKSRFNIILFLVIICMIFTPFVFSGCNARGVNETTELSRAEETLEEEQIEIENNEDAEEQSLDTNSPMPEMSKPAETAKPEASATPEPTVAPTATPKPTSKPTVTPTATPNPTATPEPIAAPETPEEPSEEEASVTSLGEFRLTAYCNCSACCGKWAGGATASGVMPVANHTIAVDTSVIPFGTEVIINGTTYVAEDTGSAIYGNRIDIYFDTHQEAMSFGVQYAEVYRVS